MKLSRCSTNQVVYVPGLGGSFDWLRRLTLWTWPLQIGAKVHFAPMNWDDAAETAEQKYERLVGILRKVPNGKCVVVAESAGGSMGVRAFTELPEIVTKLVTVCGKNRGASSITARYDMRYPALKSAVMCAEQGFSELDHSRKKSITCLYSPGDKLLRSHDTTLPDCLNLSIGHEGHGRTIWKLLLMPRSHSFAKIVKSDIQ